MELGLGRFLNCVLTVNKDRSRTRNIVVIKYLYSTSKKSTSKTEQPHTGWPGQATGIRRFLTLITIFKKSLHSEMIRRTKANCDWA